MKDKTVAAILAFFGGIVGLHRFYLGQKGWGIANVFFFSLAIASGDSTFFIMLTTLAAIFGVIDAISFLSMDERQFDQKYNQTVAANTTGNRGRRATKLVPAMNDRAKRFQQRQRERAERERERERRAKERNGQRVSPTSGGKGRHLNRSAAGSAEREAGVRYFREFAYDQAIESFKSALEKNPQDVASHFNIACAYSCEEEVDLAFYHLDRAVALGFDDFSRIRSHDSLAYLRIQPRYLTFAENNFRLVSDRREEEIALENPVSTEEPNALEPPPQDELLEQLQRLANLREKGLLTEREFAAQKRRLLG